MTFGEALRYLAEQAGVTLSRSAGSEQDKSEREVQLAAMEEAQRFFREQFRISAAAKQYCQVRGFPDELVESWGLGYAPDVSEALPTRLKKAGFELALCKELFLVDRDASGGYFAKFRGRLMMPIRDERGRLVAFGGRVIGQGQPKYINSGDTPLFTKSRVLFGLDRAREAISKQRHAVLVEGYFDVVACHRAGVPLAVAPMGTALADDQVALLKRYADKVTLLLDSDEAGQKAAERSAELLEKAGVAVRVARMGAGDDPDSLLKRDGPQAVVQTIEAAVGTTDFRVARLEAAVGVEKDEFWAGFAELLAGVPNELEREKWVERYASRYPGVRDPLAARAALRRLVARKTGGGASPRGGRAEAGRKVRAPKRPTGRDVLGVSAAERTVLYGLVRAAGRATADAVAREVDIAVTEAGADLFGRWVRFADAAGVPEGAIGEWIHAVNDEDLVSALMHVSESEVFLGTAEEVAGAAELLRSKREERRLRAMAMSGGDVDWAAWLERQRALKGGDTGETTEEDEDVFS